MTPRTARRWAIPLGLAVVYVAVLALTAGLSSHPTQPLFEGVGPTSPYKWVTPPSEFAATNQPPATLDSTVPMDAGGSTPIAASSHDGQVVLNLGAGAIPAAEAATSVNVLGTPLDPASLTPLPAPLRSDGNAYHVDMTYLPTNLGARVAKPGNIVLVVPEAADAIFYSTDGQAAWERRDTQTVGGPSTVGTTFDKPGYYLAGTTAPLSAPTTTTGGGSSWNSVLVVAGTALVGLALVLIPTMLWRSRTTASNENQSRQVRRNVARKKSKKTKRR